MLTLIARWIVNAAALLLVAYLYTGVTVESFFAAAIAALVLGLVNALVRPLLDLAGVLVDRLAATLRLFGLAGHRAVLTGEDGGGVEDPAGEEGEHGGRDSILI